MASSIHDIRKKTYSIPEVRSLTGLGRSTVYKALNTGKLSALKSGRRTVIPMEYVEDWIASFPRASFIKTG